MDQVFHYYLIAIIARAAGFSLTDATIIANASQYVDDCTKQCLPENLQLYATANYQPWSENIDDILLHFHFLPGNYYGDAPLFHPLLVTPNSFLVNAALNHGIKSGDIIQIGIASHSYADSYAHANFIGMQNSINGRYVLLNKRLPIIGHLHFANLPDHLHTIWHDSRLEDTHVNNMEKFFHCLHNLYQKYCHINSVKTQCHFIQKLQDSIGSPVLRSLASPIEHDINLYQNFFLNEFYEYLPTYNCVALHQSLGWQHAFCIASQKQKTIVQPFITQRLSLIR